MSMFQSRKFADGKGLEYFDTLCGMVWWSEMFQWQTGLTEYGVFYILQQQQLNIVIGNPANPKPRLKVQK